MNHVPLVRPDTPFYDALPDLPAAGVKVYIVLSKHANRKTCKCWPKEATIAAEAGYSERSVEAAVRDLKERGLIASQKRRKHNVYTLLGGAEDCASDTDQDPQDSAPLNGQEAKDSAPKRRSPLRQEAQSSAGSIRTPKEPPKEPPILASLRAAGAREDDQLFDSRITKPATRPRKPNPLFDAVAEAHGIQAGAKIPPSAAKRLGAVVGELKALGATPAEVRRRWALIRQAYPNVTVHALPKHWTAAGESGFGQNNHSKPRISIAKASANANIDGHELAI